MPLTKEQAIENVKTAKRELKHCLADEGLAMKGWGKAASYQAILALIVQNGVGENIFKSINEDDDE